MLYHHCATAADSRIRNYAIWTLNHLAADETNRMIMMQGGGLGKMLELLRHADPNMRRGAAETLLQFSKLLEGAPLALRKQLTSRTTLSLLILGLKVRTLTIVATEAV